MKRRRFIVGAATSLALLGGCVGGDTVGTESSPESTVPASTDRARNTSTGNPGSTTGSSKASSTAPRTTDSSPTESTTTEQTATRSPSKTTTGDAPHLGKFVLRNDDNDSHTVSISVVKGQSKLLQETYELGPGFSVGIDNPITKQGTYRIRVGTESGLATTYTWKITTCGTDELLRIHQREACNPIHGTTTNGDSNTDLFRLVSGKQIDQQRYERAHITEHQPKRSH